MFEVLLLALRLGGQLHISEIRLDATYSYANNLT